MAIWGLERSHLRCSTRTSASTPAAHRQQLVPADLDAGRRSPPPSWRRPSPAAFLRHHYSPQPPRRSKLDADGRDHTTAPRQQLAPADLDAGCRSPPHLSRRPSRTACCRLPPAPLPSSTAPPHNHRLPTEPLDAKPWRASSIPRPRRKTRLRPHHLPPIVRYPCAETVERGDDIEINRANI
jgi:hypothetical protein